MATNRYPDAPESEKGTTIETGDWFQDYVRDILEKNWGISPKSYHSKEYQMTKGEGKFCEIKHDPHTKYAHLSIEVQERRSTKGGWCVAGPFRCGQPYYIQGDKNSIWVLPTHALVRWLGDIGVWVLWEDGQRKIVSDVIDETGKITEPFPTLRRVFLEYGDARKIGGIEIVAK